MKYIILSDDNSKREYSILFPDILVHAEVSDGVRSRLRRQGIWAVPIAAGFITTDDTGSIIGVHGYSETLKLKNRGTDDLFVIYADLGLLGISVPTGTERLEWVRIMESIPEDSPISGQYKCIIERLKAD